jgi:hypothetical protein
MRRRERLATDGCTLITGGAGKICSYISDAKVFNKLIKTVRYIMYEISYIACRTGGLVIASSNLVAIITGA